MGKRRQAQLRRVIHERFVHHQPATALGQSRVPVEQATGGEAQARGVIRIDHHQHVETVDKEVDFLLQHFTHDVAVATPRFGVLGVTG
ncbi:hypothetical protein D3C78_1291710 [compost metagenome]